MIRSVFVLGLFACAGTLYIQPLAKLPTPAAEYVSPSAVVKDDAVWRDRAVWQLPYKFEIRDETTKPAADDTPPIPDLNPKRQRKCPPEGWEYDWTYSVLSPTLCYG